MGLVDWIWRITKRRRILPYATYLRACALTAYSLEELQELFLTDDLPARLEVRNHEMAKFFRLDSVDDPEKVEVEMALKTKKLYRKALETAEQGLAYGDPLEVAAEILAINPFDFTAVVSVGTAYQRAKANGNEVARRHIEQHFDLYLQRHGARTSFEEMLAYYDPRFKAKDIDAEQMDEFAPEVDIRILRPLIEDDAEEAARIHAATTSSEITQEMLDDGIEAGLYLDGCRIEKVAGKGGVGIVYKAHHEHLDRPVALKVLSKEFAAKPEQIQTFKEEARAAAKLEHPNIIAVYNFGICYDRPYMVMQWIAGGSMQDKLNSGRPLPLDDALDYVAQAARGLERAHAAGIVHRDIKPDNLLIGEDDVVRVADFGLAQAVKADDLEGNKTGKVMGTPAYIPPEQAQGEAAGPAADIYSLGVTLFHAVTGKRPYGGSLMQVLYKHVTEPLPSSMDANPQVPEQLDKIIRWMCAKVPEDRPDSAGIVADTLEAMCNKPRRRPGAAAVPPDSIAGRAGARQVPPTISPGGPAAPDNFGSGVLDLDAAASGDMAFPPDAQPVSGDSGSASASVAAVLDLDGDGDEAAPTIQGGTRSSGDFEYRTDDAQRSDADPNVTPDALDKGLSEGMEIGNCRIERPLGKGGMGVVYRARDLSLDRPVAVKVMTARFTPDTVQYKRFQKEARSAARLQHNNVVQVFAFGTMHQHPYIVMEYVDGQSMMDRLRAKGPLQIHEVFGFFAQAAAGISAAHKQKIIHRDIKPDNLMITSDGVIKVADFGLAKETEAGTQLSVTGSVMGTPHYMPPEQVRGDSELTPRADIYALGMSIFHATTGKLPFTGSVMRVLYAQINEPLPDMREIRKDVPDGLAELVMRMGEKDAARRPATIDEVEAELRRLADPFGRPASGSQSTDVSSAAPSGSGMVGPPSGEAGWGTLDDYVKGLESAAAPPPPLPSSGDADAFAPTMGDHGPVGAAPPPSADDPFAPTMVGDDEDSYTISDGSPPPVSTADPDPFAATMSDGTAPPQLPPSDAFGDADPFAATMTGDEAAGYTADPFAVGGPTVGGGPPHPPSPKLPSGHVDGSDGWGESTPEPPPAAPSGGSWEDADPFAQTITDDVRSPYAPSDGAVPPPPGAAPVEPDPFGGAPQQDDPFGGAGGDAFGHSPPQGEGPDSGGGQQPAPRRKAPPPPPGAGGAGGGSSHPPGFAPDQFLSLLAGMLMLTSLFLPLGSTPAATRAAVNESSAVVSQAVAARSLETSVDRAPLLDGARAAWKRRVGLPTATAEGAIADGTAGADTLLMAGIADLAGLVRMPLAAGSAPPVNVAGELGRRSAGAAADPSIWNTLRVASFVQANRALFTPGSRKAAHDTWSALVLLPMVALLLVILPLVLGLRPRRLYSVIVIGLTLAGLAGTLLVIMRASPLGVAAGLPAGAGVGAGTLAILLAGACLLAALVMAVRVVRPRRSATPHHHPSQSPSPA